MRELESTGWPTSQPPQQITGEVAARFRFDVPIEHRVMNWPIMVRTFSAEVVGMVLEEGGLSVCDVAIKRFTGYADASPESLGVQLAVLN